MSQSPRWLDLTRPARQLQELIDPPAKAHRLSARHACTCWVLSIYADQVSHAAGEFVPPTDDARRRSICWWLLALHLATGQFSPVSRFTASNVPPVTEHRAKALTIIIRGRSSVSDRWPRWHG